MKTPIALIMYKRPETTQQVFEIIRQAQPSQLFVIANSPRPDRPEEIERCAATRAIIDQVDWKCEVVKKYSETHRAVGEQISGGLSWLFDQVEEAIILEDDCLLDPSFFPFCEELLERYRHDPRICSISAPNVQLGRSRTEHSYYFSRYSLLWGWGTWRRAWQQYDYTMKQWEAVKQRRQLREWLDDSTAVRYWTQLFQDTYDGRIRTWDYQWTLSCWLHGTLSIHPDVNLVRNIGFGADATNMSGFDNKTIHTPVQPMQFPLRHPPEVVRHVQADLFTQRVAFEGGWLRQFKNSVRRFAKRTLGVRIGS